MTDVDSRSEEVSIEQTYLPWIVCFVGSLFFFYEFIQMNMFNAINTSLMHDFQLSAEQLAKLSSTYFLASVAFLLPAGMILDRFSTRKVMLVSLTICVIGTYLFSIAESTYIAAVCRFFTGIGSAFCFLSNVRLATRWFPENRIALVTGLIVTMAMIGGVVAQWPLTHLVEALGWRHALVIDAALGLIVVMLIWFFVQDYPPHRANQAIKDKKALHSMGFFTTMKMAFLNYHNWLCGMYTCLLNVPIFVLGFIGTVYLTSVHHITHEQASIVTMMIFIGTIFGSPFVGWLSDRIGLRKPPMIIGAILSIVTVLILMYSQDMSMGMLMLVFLMLGFFTSSQVISYPVVSESNPTLLTAMSVSCVSFTTLGGGGVILQPFFGWLLDWHSAGKMLAGVPVYNAADFRFAMWIFPIGFLIGLIATFFIRETHCKNESV